MTRALDWIKSHILLFVAILIFVFLVAPNAVMLRC